MPRHKIAKSSDVTLVSSQESAGGSAYRITPKPVPTPDLIVEQLKHAGIVNSAKGLQLLMLPRNSLRNDYVTRADFKVTRSGRPVCYLSVGRNLADLRSRSEAFTKACPALACRPLFWRRVDGWDYFATEYFEGNSLDSELLSGRISSTQVEKTLGLVVGLLEKTTHASTTSAIERELGQIFSTAANLPVFGDYDRVMLEGVVFAFIRAGALSVVPQTRWTNGDFIPQNLLISPSGEVRLIDYEFAARSHFFAADGWRWRRFSRLPADLRESTTLAGSQPTGRWFEALCLLQHMVALHQVHPASIALDESRLCARELIDIVSQAHAGFRAEALLRFMIAPTPTHPLAVSGPKVQLFWSPTGDFSEALTQSKQYQTTGEGVYRFDFRAGEGPLKLRFDPINAPGLLEISAIRVRQGTGKQPLLSLNDSTGWEGLQLAADLLRLPDSPLLNLLSLGDDPILLLPDIKVDLEAELTVEVWMRYSAELRGLQHILLPLLRAPAAAVLGLGDESTTRESEMQILLEVTQRQAAGFKVEHERLQAEHAMQIAADQARATERISQLETEVQGQRQQLEEALAATEQVKAEYEAVATRLRETEAARDADILGLRQQVETAQAATMQAKAEQEAVATRLRETDAAREAEKLNLQQQVDAAQAAIKEAKAEQEAVATRLRETEAAREAEKLNLQQQVDAAQAAIKKAEAEQEAVATRLRETETAREAEILGLRQQLEAAQAAAKQAKAEQEALATQHQASDSAHAAENLGLQQQLSRLSKAANEDAGRIATLETEILRLRQLENALPVAVADALQAKNENLALSVRLKSAEAAQQAAQLAESTSAGRLALLTKHVESLEGKLAAAILQAEVAVARVDASNESTSKLEQKLSAIGEELAVERKNATALLAEFRQLEVHYRRLEQEYFRQQTALSQQEDLLKALRQEAGLRSTQSASLVEAVTRERDDILARCERMKLSFSWRITSPLRWLRRRLIDSENTRSK